MSVQTEITRLESAKSDIAAAITAKGVEVPEGTTLDGMAALINQIACGLEFDTPVASFVSGSTAATSDNTIAVEYNLSHTPTSCIFFAVDPSDFYNGLVAVLYHVDGITAGKSYVWGKYKNAGSNYYEALTMTVTMSQTACSISTNKIAYKPYSGIIYNYIIW